MKCKKSKILENIIFVIGCVVIAGAIFGQGADLYSRIVLLSVGASICVIAKIAIVRWIVLSALFSLVWLVGIFSVMSKGSAPTSGEIFALVVCPAIALFCGYKAYRHFKPKPIVPMRQISLSEIDMMDGLEFEEFTAQLLRQLGYVNVAVTRASGDQGIDVLATKDGTRYAIQCKNYANKLDNTPVQEAYAGKQFYGYDVGVVMTNSTFTKGAYELANAVGVLLWDRNILQSMINQASRWAAPVEDVAPVPKPIPVPVPDHTPSADIEPTLRSIYTATANTEDVIRGLRLGISDELFYEAVDAVLAADCATVSLIQRRLNLGYARAARIMDEMELKGIVGPFQGSTPRDILISAEQWILICSQRFAFGKKAAHNCTDDSVRPKYTEVDDQFISQAQWYSAHGDAQK